MYYYPQLPLMQDTLLVEYKHIIKKTTDILIDYTNYLEFTPMPQKRLRHPELVKKQYYVEKKTPTS